MEKSESDLLLEANKFYDVQDYANAITAYKSALEKNKTAPTLHQIGLSYAMLEDYSEAAKWFEDATQEDPNNAKAYRNWGLALARQKNLEGAIEKYKLAIQKDPNFALAYFSWGLVLEEQTDIEGAIAKYELATQKDPGYSKAYDCWGLALEKKEEWDKAVQVYREAIKNVDEKEKANFHVQLGNVLRKKEYFGDAMDQYDAAITLDESSVSVYYYWGNELAEQSSKFDEAVEKYQKAIDIVKDQQRKADGHKRLGDAYRGKERYEDAIEQYDTAIAIDETHVVAYYLWARDLARQPAKFKEVVEKYEKAIEVVKDQKRKAEGHKRLGDAYQGKKLYDKALNEYSSAIEKDQNNILVYYEWANILAHQPGQFDKAVQKYKEGIYLALDEEKVEGYRRLGDIFREKERYEDAVEQYRQALVLSPKNYRARDGWAKVLAKKYWTSKKFTDSYSNVLRDKGEGYFTLAEALREEKHFPESIRYYQQTIEINPDNPDAHIGLANALTQQGDHLKAVEQFKLAISKDRLDLVYDLGKTLTFLSEAEIEGQIRDLSAILPNKDKSEGFKRLGDAFREKGFYNEAIKSYETAYSENSEDASPLIFLGHCFYDLKNYSKAKDYYNQFIEQNKDNENNWDVASAYRMLGWIFSDKSDFEKAIESFDMAEKKYENYGWGILGRARIRLDTGEYELALADIKKAIDTRPNVSDFYAEYGYSYEIQEDYDKAIEQYRIAVDKAENEADPHFRLGYALASIKRYEDAIAEYKKTEEITPGNPIDITPIMASHNHADILQTEGKYEQARKKWKSTYEKYLTIMPIMARQRNADIYQYAGSIAWEFIQEFDQKEKAFTAELLYKKGLEFDPKHTGLLLSLLQLYADCKKLLEYGGQKLDPKNKWLAQVLSILNRSDDFALIRKSVEINWQAMQTLQKLIQVLDQKLRNAESQKLSGRLVAQYYLQRAKANLAVERCEEARKDAQKAIDLDPRSADAYSTLGVILMLLEEYKDAIQSFKSAMERDVDNLGYLSNLAEAYRKAEMLDEAKKQYELTLKISPYQIDSVIGIAETYTAIGDGPKDGKRSVDAEEMYTKAIDYYSRALGLLDKDEASKILKPHEIGAIRYSRGYARAMLFEAQSGQDERLLRDAQRDFESIPSTDKNYQKAKRSAKKIAEKLRRFSPSKIEQRAGLWIIGIAALVFVIGQIMFVFGQPRRVPPGYQLTDTVVEELKAVGLPEDLLVNMSLLVSQRFDSPQALVEAVSKIAGDKMTLDIQKQVVSNIETVPATFDFQPVDVGYYALFTFGPLIFVVAGAYLQQISKLKFAGIEIEKIPVDQISTSSSLGVSK